MTIEVRQLTISSRVGEPDRGTPDEGAASLEGAPSAELPAWIAQLRRELLSECRSLVDARLDRATER